MLLRRRSEASAAATRIVAACALATLVAAAGCSTGVGGSVVVRWQLVDSSTGEQANLSVDSSHHDWCVADVVGFDRAVRQVVVEQIHLVLLPADGGDGGASPVECPSCRFGCASGEHVTDFDVPGGDYLMSIEGQSCGVRVGDTPPAVRRTVKIGAVTNLNSIEILLGPTTRTCDDTPSADMM